MYRVFDIVVKPCLERECKFWLCKVLPVVYISASTEKKAWALLFITKLSAMVFYFYADTSTLELVCTHSN